MKRDWEIIRQILLGLEQLETTLSVRRPNQIDGYDSELVSYLQSVRAAHKPKRNFMKLLDAAKWA